jgi:drug/metabolite transporter (DMT)-like permease
MRAVSAEPPFPLAGELACLGASLIWSCSMSIFTACGRHVPAQALNLFKNLVAGACLLVAALFIPWPGSGEARAFGVLAASGIVGLSLGDTALFAALRRLGAQITSASQCLAPPVSALIAALFLSETLSAKELGGLLLTAGAVGVLIFFSQRRGAQLSGMPGKTVAFGLGLCLLSATCQGAGVVLQRFAMQRVDVVYGTLSRVLPAILVLALITHAGSGGAAKRMQAIFVRRRDAVLLTIAAFAGTFLGLLLMAAGAKYAKAGIAAALLQTYPIWIIPIARFVLKEKIQWQSIVCTVVAVGGIVLMVL